MRVSEMMRKRKIAASREDPRKLIRHNAVTAVALTRPLMKYVCAARRADPTARTTTAPTPPPPQLSRCCLRAARLVWALGRESNCGGAMPNCGLCDSTVERSVLMGEDSRVQVSQLVASFSLVARSHVRRRETLSKVVSRPSTAPTHRPIQSRQRQHRSREPRHFASIAAGAARSELVSRCSGLSIGFFPTTEHRHHGRRAGRPATTIAAAAA